MEGSHQNLSEPQVYELLTEAGVCVAPYRKVTSPEHASQAAEALGFPVVCKVISPDILHKSKLGGVVCNITTPTQVQQTYRQVLEKVSRAQPEARIEGCLICRQMVSAQAEVIVGTTIDDEFGRVIMFGVGGELAEYLHCVEFRSFPVSPQEALQLVLKVQRKMYTIAGWKSMKPEIPAGLIVSFCKVLQAHPEIESIDINPAVLYLDSYAVIDAKGVQVMNHQKIA
jgi:succinyl-CoA synthetase beta subunit